MITLGVPSKGRLMEKTFAWFAARGVEMRRTGSDRDYGAEVAGLSITLRLLSAGEIPRELATGRIHLGVTGSDLVQERIPAWDQSVQVLSELGFGHADLIIAVPAWWVDVRSLDDLDSVAADFRATHGHRLRIATKYHRLVRDFLRDAGVADYRLADCLVATEGTVAHGTAEAIADITSTGESLRANHLAILEDGLIHRSEATLFRSRKANWDGSAKKALEDLTNRLEIV